jgi:hypothetical protein
MRHYRKEQQSDMVIPVTETPDSPTIKNLIEQLDRDLEETESKASQAQ